MIPVLCCLSPPHSRPGNSIVSRHLPPLKHGRSEVPARRGDYARRPLHRLQLRSSSADHTSYADAAISPDSSTPILSTAGCDVEGHHRATQVFTSVCSSRYAELWAIHHCLSSIDIASLAPSSSIAIYTDSQEALCSHGHPSPVINNHSSKSSGRPFQPDGWSLPPGYPLTVAFSVMKGLTDYHVLQVLSAQAGSPMSPMPPELTLGSFHDTQKARQVQISQRRQYLTSRANPLEFPLSLSVISP